MKAIAILTATLLATVASAAATPLSVERVTLATGGLALLEGRPATPTNTIVLDAERRHVADILRTLLVTGDGTVASADLVGAEGVSPETPVGRLIAGGLGDPLSLLRATVGEAVTLRGGPQQLSGTLLGFQNLTLPAGEGQPGRAAVSVSVLTADGAMARATFALDESLDISGTAVDSLLSEAIPVLREARSSDRRSLTVRLDGEAQPTLSFVIPTTVWRPSYRAAFSGDGPAMLQGWATLENTTGFNWSGVDLRLAVGTPVAYAQDVYAPLRVTRPNAPFTVGQTLEAEIVAPRRERRAMMAAAPAVAEMAFADTEALSMGAVTGAQIGTDSALSVFDVPGEIDLGAGRTLSVPFFQSAGVATRSAYLALANGNTVMDALMVDTSAGTQLPGGLIAVYGADGYLGDARFAGSTDGAQIVPFAVAGDLSAAVTSERSTELTDFAVGDGVLRLTREAIERTDINLTAEAQRTVIIDIPVQAGQTLTGQLNGFPVAADPVSPTLVRLEITLRPGENALAATATRTLDERIAAVDLSQRLLRDVIARGDRLPANKRAEVEALAEALAEIAALERDIRTAEADISGLRDAIALDRETLQVIDPATAEGAALRQRLIERTNEIDLLLQRQTALRAEILVRREAAFR